MYKRLYSFLDTYEILYPPFGIREKHYLVFVKNTPLPNLFYLLLSQSNILLTMANMVWNFFFICRKLLTLNHDIIVTKLEHYGIRDNDLSWFKPYLCGRSQYVSVNGFPSDLLPITCGVPEGSVLGPFYFSSTSMICQVYPRYLGFIYLLMTAAYILNMTICQFCKNC